MSTPVSSTTKPPSRKPVSFFVAKPKETDTKEDKAHALRLKALTDNIVEPRSYNPLGSPEQTIDDSFQDVKHKEPIRKTKTKTKVEDYSKDLSDHESESVKSD
jgi:hypothetical protein